MNMERDIAMTWKKITSKFSVNISMLFNLSAYCTLCIVSTLEVKK